MEPGDGRPTGPSTGCVNTLLIVIAMFAAVGFIVYLIKVAS